MTPQVQALQHSISEVLAGGELASGEEGAKPTSTTTNKLQAEEGANSMKFDSMRFVCYSSEEYTPSLFALNCSPSANNACPQLRFALYGELVDKERHEYEAAQKMHHSWRCFGVAIQTPVAPVPEAESEQQAEEEEGQELQESDEKEYSVQLTRLLNKHGFAAGLRLDTGVVVIAVNDLLRQLLERAGIGCGDVTEELCRGSLCEIVDKGYVVVLFALNCCLPLTAVCP